MKRTPAILLLSLAIAAAATACDRPNASKELYLHCTGERTSVLIEEDGTPVNRNFGEMVIEVKVGPTSIHMYDEYGDEWLDMSKPVENEEKIEYSYEMGERFIKLDRTFQSGIGSPTFERFRIVIDRSLGTLAMQVISTRVNESTPYLRKDQSGPCQEFDPDNPKL